MKQIKLILMLTITAVVVTFFVRHNLWIKEFMEKNAVEHISDRQSQKDNIKDSYQRKRIKRRGVTGNLINEEPVRDQESRTAAQGIKALPNPGVNHGGAGEHELQRSPETLNPLPGVVLKKDFVHVEYEGVDAIEDNGDNIADLSREWTEKKAYDSAPVRMRKEKQRESYRDIYLNEPGKTVNHLMGSSRQNPTSTMP